MSLSSRLVLAAALALAVPAVATADPAAPQAQISDASSKAPVQAADDAKDYAQRESKDAKVADYRGGSTVIVGFSGGALLALLCLILIL
jgi:predicted methyltransferase